MTSIIDGLEEVKLIKRTYDDYSVFLNTMYRKFPVSMFDLNDMIENSKKQEYNNLQLSVSYEINHSRKEFNVWITPIVSSA